MSYKIIITTNANRDIQNAIDWEEERHKGLGRKFYKDLNQRLKDLSFVPAIGSIRYDDVHCVETKIFHYLIHYIISNKTKEITVLRIWPTKQKPLWE